MLQSRKLRDVVMFLCGLGVGLGLRSLASAATPGSKRLGKQRLGDIPAGGPAESWRGSGLAEDVGANPAAAAGEDPDRERKMREAERLLGLPEA